MSCLVIIYPYAQLCLIEYESETALWGQDGCDVMFCCEWLCSKERSQVAFGPAADAMNLTKRDPR
jgi:hypothetical protein